MQAGKHFENILLSITLTIISECRDWCGVSWWEFAKKWLSFTVSHPVFLIGSRLLDNPGIWGKCKTVGCSRSFGKLCKWAIPFHPFL